MDYVTPSSSLIVHRTPPPPPLHPYPTPRSALTHVRVALKGAGIAPELQLSPPGATTSGLDLGDVAVGEASSTTLTVTNVCPFPLSFAMRLAGRATAADPNLGCRLPFACQPAEGTLAQGESCEVAVSFRPSSQRPYFEDVLQVGNGVGRRVGPGAGMRC